MKKALKYILYAFIAMTVIGIIIAIIDPSGLKTEEDKTAASTSPVELAYSIVDKDVSGTQITYRVTIDDRIDDKRSLIEVARKLKEASKDEGKEQLVCHFDIKVHSQSYTWASCAYLPKCETCPTDKDADGTPIQYFLVGVTKALADSLQRLNLDTIENKTLIASYIEDIFKCKTQLYIVNNDSSRMLLAKLFNSGGYYLEWLSLKQVNGEKRYYYNDDDPNDINYILLDEANHLVNYRTEEGKTWQVYKYDL